MRRSFVTLGFLACFQLLAPAPAHAFVRYIWELSGPGFLGPHVMLRLVCIPAKEQKPVNGEEPPTVKLASNGDYSAAIASAVFGSGCLRQLEVVPKASVNLEGQFMWSVTNPYKYEDVSNRVFLIAIEPSVSVNLSRVAHTDRIELGFGVGVFIFRGPALETFSRVFIEPIRVDYRPFTKPGWNRLIVRGSAMVLPRGFAPQDFGAISGPVNSAAEIRPQLGVTVDLRRWSK